MGKDWTEIAAFYAHLAGVNPFFAPMARLAAQIEASSYRRLYGQTSMHDLCLAQGAHAWPDWEPYLRISPLDGGRIAFRYFDTYVTERQWSRIVEGDAAFARLKRFIEQLRWFPLRSCLADR
jgi:hypothetical protein